MFLSSEQFICEPVSLIITSTVLQAQAECILMNSLTIQEKQALNVTLVSVNWQQKQLFCIYLQTSWQTCITRNITWDEMLLQMPIKKEILSSGFVMAAYKVEWSYVRKPTITRMDGSMLLVFKKCPNLDRLFAWNHCIGTIAASVLNNPLLLTWFCSKQKKFKTILLTTNLLGKQYFTACASGFQNIDVPYAHNFVLNLTANADH